MTNHNRYFIRGPPSPVELNLNEVLPCDDKYWGNFYETPEMAPTFSQHSFESALESSPPSWQSSSYLDAQQFSQPGPSVSPMMTPSATFEHTNSFGTWAEESCTGPLMLTEADLGFDQSPSMFDRGAEAGYSQNETIMAESYGSAGVYEVPLETLSEATSGMKPDNRCTFPGCSSGTNFTRKTDLKRHERSLHTGEKFDCKYTWCGRTGEGGFARKDHYLEHLREVHRRKDIPKIVRRRSQR